MEENKKTEQLIRKRTVLSFSIFILAGLLIVAGWKWLNEQPEENGMLKPLREIIKVDEQVNNSLFGSHHQAKEYPETMAVKDVRVNGDIGMSENFDPGTWKLLVQSHPEKTNSLASFTMKDISALPKKQVIFNFKCIEGWSQITNWSGVRFIDFLKKFKLGTRSGKAPDSAHPEDMYAYVGLMTPDSAYYVGIDMKSMLHPQTILCFELNNKPLPIDQGFPLRLIIPVKYGIKHLKRIGYIYFSDTPPQDYWHERGYIYDASL
jgi:DMSO/TMAO reductase YedYZ molybdopterin-dependent catalytic subunit